MSEEKEEKKDKLTPKQKKFVEAYLGEAHFNATRAAELAGYKGSRQTLGAVAYENLKKPQIKAEIDLCLSAMTMPANVVLTRLTEIADGKLADFYDDKGKFNLELAKERGVDHLLKKVKVKRTVREKTTTVDSDAKQKLENVLGEDEIEILTTDVQVVYEETEFEIYSAHEALRDLGKHHKLFTEKIEAEQNINLPERLANSLEKALLKAYGGESGGK